jgi:hypothetical protein
MVGAEGFEERNLVLAQADGSFGGIEEESWVEVSTSLFIDAPLLRVG